MVGIGSWSDLVSVLCRIFVVVTGTGFMSVPGTGSRLISGLVLERFHKQSYLYIVVFSVFFFYTWVVVGRGKCCVGCEGGGCGVGGNGNCRSS